MKGRTFVVTLAQGEQVIVGKYVNLLIWEKEQWTDW